MAHSGQLVKKPVSLEPQPEPRLEPGPGHKLQSWQLLVCYLCFYGFMAQIRPGESFITPYLLGPDKDFTRKQACGLGAGRTGLWTRGIVGRGAAWKGKQLRLLRLGGHVVSWVLFPVP